MVKILSLYAINFKRLSFDQPLKMPEGVTLICGPNESGKSTLLDAILYGLYARVTRPTHRPRSEDIITYGRNQALVRLDFSVGGRNFRVERRIYLKRPNDARLWEILPNGLRLIATGQRPVTNEIEKLLGGISFHEIIASNIVAQKDLEHLINQGKEGRKRIINAFLNLESFNTVPQELNEERKSIEGTHVQPGLLRIERQKLEHLQEKLEEYRKKKKELENTRQEIQKLKKEINDVEKKFCEVKKLCEVLEIYDEAYEKKRNLTTKIEEKRNFLTELEKQLKNFQKIEDDLDQALRELEEYADLEEVERSLEKANNLKTKLSELEIQYNQKRKRENSVKKEIFRLEERLQGIDVEMATKLEKQRIFIWPYIIGTVLCFSLAFILSTSDIPITYLFILIILGVLMLFMVGRQISSESRMRQLLSDIRSLKSLQRESLNLGDQIRILINKMQEIEDEITNICRDIKRYNQIFNIHRLEGSQVILRVMLDRFEEEKQHRNRLEERVGIFKAQLEKKAEIIDKYGKTEKEVNDLQKALEKIVFPELPENVEFSKDLLKQIREQKRDLENDLTEKKTLLGKYQENVEKLTRYMKENEDLPAHFEEQRKRVSILERRLKIVKLAIEAVDKTAEALRNRVQPNVEQYMGIILLTITNGRYKAVQLDENFNLKVWDPDAGEFKLKEVFSGGTEDQLLLSMRLAFALALLPKVKGMHPEFLFLDEPLASSDKERREGIIQLLKKLSSRFRQIFIISHVADLETEVQNVIRLENGRVIETITR